LWCLCGGYIDFRLKKGPPVPTLLTAGWETIFTRLKAKHTLNIVHEAPVTAVT
jgi:hypothetical protein